MRRFSRKYTYNQQAFGERIGMRRRALGWSYRKLTQQLFDQESVTMAAATLLHVERGDRPLPMAQRAALERVLFPTATIDVASNARNEPTSSGLPDSSKAGDPSILESGGHWEAARVGFIAQATAASARGDWSVWATQYRHAAMMELTLGRYERSASLLAHIFASGHGEIPLSIRGEAYQDRGWLNMARCNYEAAATDLLRSGQILRSVGMDYTRTLHFLGRTYCAWGIAADNEHCREAGRMLLACAFEHDQQQNNAPGMGYDLLQQVASMVFDDIDLASRYLAQSRELLGMASTSAGHYYVSVGIIDHLKRRNKSHEHWERATLAYSEGFFYPNGLSRALRLLSSDLEDNPTTLSQAASCALVAAIAYPYVQSLQRLEEVATRLFVTSSGYVVRRFTTFWADQFVHVRAMDESPFTLLRLLVQRPDGPLYIQRSMKRAADVIQRALPNYLSAVETRMAEDCLQVADVT